MASRCSIPTFLPAIPAFPGLPAFPSFPPTLGLVLAFTLPACPLD